MANNWRLVFFCFLIGIFSAIPLALITKNIQSPQSLGARATNQIAENSQTGPKKVIGFFPYWNLDKVTEVDLSALDTIYYFAVDLNADGSINTADPGWARLKSSKYALLKDLAKRSGIRWGVTMINLSATSIAQNINNPLRQQTIIANTINLMKQEGFQDLNIDLEYAGDPDETLKKSFTSFVQKLTARVKAEIPESVVTIDFFSDSYKNPRIYDLSAIGRIVDHVVIMGYDFHRLNSIKAGPVAPVFGKEIYEYDISSTVDGYLKLIPQDKLILGIPFYGYEWPTLTSEKNSFTIYSPRGPEISSYKRSVETAQNENASINFDDLSKSVWFSYFDSENRSWRQVWFENERSLGIKFDLVNNLRLAGIAIFAVGYDGADASPLWNEVRLKLK